VGFFFKSSIFNTYCIWKSCSLVKSTLYIIEYQFPFTCWYIIVCTRIYNPNNALNGIAQYKNMHCREMLKLQVAKNRNATMICRETGSVHDLNVGRLSSCSNS
jgi:hypothetical protein